MTLEDFEKSLLKGKIEDGEENIGARDGKHEKHRKHHRRAHHVNGDDPHRRKRSKHSKDADEHEHGFRAHSDIQIKDVVGGEIQQGGDSRRGGNTIINVSRPSESILNPSFSSIGNELRRDSWMEAPSSLDIELRHKNAPKRAEPVPAGSLKVDFELKIHENELNKHHLQKLAEGKEIDEDVTDQPARDEVDYVFGDAGSKWRMTRLKAVFRQADEEGKPVEIIALERFGDLRAFDDAREEQIEIERRETYGKGYIGKEKPSGELFQERKLDSGPQIDTTKHSQKKDVQRNEDLDYNNRTTTQEAGVLMDSTALNKLKAQMLKAKLRGSSDAPALEAEYAQAIELYQRRPEPGIVVLAAMENRMLAGGRNGEVNAVTTKRGHERGLVEENENMSVEDMVREERRMRNQAGGDGRRFAERIAKDGKFINDLDYMDENANKLAKRVQKSEINLKNIAISDFQKINRILDSCPLCHQEDRNLPPVAPVVSLATRVYLTLPTEPEISEGGAMIVPIQHRGNLLECDEDEWEEIRNFMKCLTRMYHDQGRDVIFYENAAVPQRKKHARIEAVPLPYSLGETAPAFFKEAILSSDEEWSQHKKIVDTLAKAKQGLGKLAFSRTLVKEMPYFHVWFEIDGGLGHIVEDANRWPKGDLFAREIIGGMLEKGPDVIKRQGRWTRGRDGRVDGFRKRWYKFDWTKVLTDS